MLRCNSSPGKIENGCVAIHFRRHRSLALPNDAAAHSKIHPLLSHSIRAAFCGGVDAGRRKRTAESGHDRVDSPSHGLRPNGGHGVQPDRRLGNGQTEPADCRPDKLVSKATAYGLVGFSSLAFLVICSFINPVCSLLSPVALAVIFLYSFTKRFTSYTQFFLGLSLAIAPVGAWLAVRGQFAWPPIILALGVIFWVGGFDLIYATQDYDFDRQQGLHSMVVRPGVPASLRLAQGMHVILLFCLLGGFGLVSNLGWIYYLSLLAVGGALFY